MIVCTALLQKHFSSGWLKNKYFHLITWRYRGWFLYKPARRKSSNSTEVNGVTLVWNQGQIRIGPLWCADCLVPQRWHLFEQTSMLRSFYNSFSFIIWCAHPLYIVKKKFPWAWYYIHWKDCLLCSYEKTRFKHTFKPNPLERMMHSYIWCSSLSIFHSQHTSPAPETIKEDTR